MTTKKTTKKKTVKKDDFFASFADHIGGKKLAEVGQEKYFIDTGNLAINRICSGKFFGGGIPTGITEVYGPPASSKSLLGYTLLGAVQRMGGYAILLDCERAANQDFAVTAGHVNEDGLIVTEPFFIEEITPNITSAVRYIREHRDKEAPILFVFDSISVIPCEREWKETDLDTNYKDADWKKVVGGKEQPGERAKAAGKFLRKINPFLNENNASLFIINQTRESIGVMFGSPEVTAGGGKALPFYANCRVRTAVRKPIMDAKKDVAIGVELAFQNKKSRSTIPYMKAENVHLYFDRGLNPVSGLLSVLINSGRVEKVSNGNYKIVSSGKTFKSSATRNDVPLDLLRENPDLVDADSKEQVEEYLKLFSGAIDLSNSDDVTIGDEATNVADKFGIDLGD